MLPKMYTFNNQKMYMSVLYLTMKKKKNVFHTVYCMHVGQESVTE